MNEIELALKWFEMNDISAYNTNEDLFVEVNNDTHSQMNGQQKN